MRLNLSTHLFVFFVLLYPVLTKGQIRQPRFDILSVENGLPENFPTFTMQDHRGYIWIGTQNGLVRYDGHDMKIYNLEKNGKPVKGYLSIENLLEVDSTTIWVVTGLQGLAKYDQTTDKLTLVEDIKNGEGKSAVKNINAIRKGKNGEIWMLSDKESAPQIVCHNIRTKKTKIYKLTPKDSNKSKISVQALRVDSKGDVWFSTNKGLYTITHDTNNAGVSTVKNDYLKTATILKIYEASSQPGVLWLLQTLNGNNRLIKFTPLTGNTEFYPISEKGSLDIFEDRQKRLWIASNNALAHFDRRTNKFNTYQAKEKITELESIRSIKISENNEGSLWVKTSKGLLYLSSKQGSELIRYTTNSSEKGSLPNNFVWDLLMDRSGTEWFGIRDYGLLKLNQSRSKIQYITENNNNKGYPGGPVVSMVQLKNGGFLICTTEGLYESDKTFTTFKPFSLKNANTELKLTGSGFLKMDRQGHIWIASHEGLIKYNPLTKKTKIYTHNPKDPHSVSSNKIQLVMEDSKGKLWVGTVDAGICRLDPLTGKFTRYPFIRNNSTIIVKDGSLDDNLVASILEDKDGIIWVGTNLGSLNKFNEATGKFTSYFNNPKLTCVIELYEDKRGRLWAGTYLWGLFLVDKKTGAMRQFLKKDGLIFDGVLNINEDDSGRIWVGSDGGLSIIDPDTFHVKTFGTNLGLPDTFGYSYITTGLNGDWLYGMKNGIMRFNPNDFKSNLIPPDLVLQQLTYSNGNAKGTFVKQVKNDKQVNLSYDYNKLVFKYVGLHYVNAKMNQYKYQLEGYDKDWINAGTERTATYTNLAPGTYNFRFKASNSDGVWSKKTAELRIIISPPWWKTWWAYLLYIAFFAIIIQVYIAYRSRTLKNRNQKLEEQVNARTRELSEANEELKASQEEIISQRDELEQTVNNLNTTQTQLIQAEKMASLGELTAGIAHEIQNPLNFVNNFSDLSMELIKEMQEEFEKGDTVEAFAIASDIKVNLEKINHHGKRADSIVKGMLQHSRTGSATKEMTDINALADEYLRLAYHGLRAKDKNFNAELITNFDPTLPKIKVLAQDVGRVFLNLYTNAFYATNEKQKLGSANYKPVVEVSTLVINATIEIKVRDNGTGIPDSIRDKILNPFFTTKPSGEGTGLGLSLSYDIIVKAHGGQLQIESVPGESTTFKILLPFN